MSTVEIDPQTIAFDVIGRWISFKFGTLIRHILAYLHLNLKMVKLNFRTGVINVKMV